mmetsp:Transcript_22798/g.54557  ORF Transcript_22798/g.54557 Transcript_22798/m.54557 type:complete len:416 (-) Transcript_22798:675-1922(-)
MIRDVLLAVTCFSDNSPSETVLGSGLSSSITSAKASSSSFFNDWNGLESLSSRISRASSRSTAAARPSRLQMISSFRSFSSATSTEKSMEQPNVSWRNQSPSWTSRGTSTIRCLWRSSRKKTNTACLKSWSAMSSRRESRRGSCESRSLVLTSRSRSSSARRPAEQALEQAQAQPAHPARSAPGTLPENAQAKAAISTGSTAASSTTEGDVPSGISFSGKTASRSSSGTLRKRLKKMFGLRAPGWGEPGSGRLAAPGQGRSSLRYSMTTSSATGSESSSDRWKPLKSDQTVGWTSLRVTLCVQRLEQHGSSVSPSEPTNPPPLGSCFAGELVRRSAGAAPWLPDSGASPASPLPAPVPHACPGKRLALSGRASRDSNRSTRRSAFLHRNLPLTFIVRSPRKNIRILSPLACRPPF